MDSTSYSDDFEASSHPYSNDSFEAESPTPCLRNCTFSSCKQTGEAPETSLRLLRRENADLRGQLRTLNETLNTLIARKLANGDYKPTQSSRPALSLAELNRSTQLLHISSKEHADLSARTQLLSDPAYADQLKATVQRQASLLLQLQRTCRQGRNLQQVVEKDLEREIKREEREQRGRGLALAQAEVEEYEGKNWAAEQENERITEQIAEISQKADNLEEKYAKLMAIARYQGVFQDQSRSKHKAKRLRKRLEATQAQFHCLSVKQEAELKALQRQEAELSTELEELRRKAGESEQELEGNRAELRGSIAEVGKIRPKVLGTDYAVLLEKVAKGLAAQEAAFSLLNRSKEPAFPPVSAVLATSELPKVRNSAVPPWDTSPLQAKVEFKPALFCFAQSLPPTLPSPSSEAEPRTKRSQYMSKPGLFASAQTLDSWNSPHSSDKSTLFPAHYEAEMEGKQDLSRPAELSSFPTFDSFPSRRRGKPLPELTTSLSQPVLPARTGRDRSHLLQEMDRKGAEERRGGVLELEESDWKC